MPELATAEADLKPGGGYAWRFSLCGGTGVHLMGGRGALHGALLASGTTLAAAGTVSVAGAQLAPSLCLPTRSGAPASPSRILVRLSSVHPAAAAALVTPAGAAVASVLRPGQQWAVSVHTTMLQPRTPSQQQQQQQQQAAADGEGCRGSCRRCWLLINSIVVS